MFSELLLESLVYPQNLPAGGEMVAFKIQTPIARAGRIETEKSRSLSLFFDIVMLLAYFTERLLYPS